MPISQAIIYEERRIKRMKKEVTNLLVMDQKIRVEKHVICFWKIREKLEGIFEMTFTIQKARKTDHLPERFACYQVVRNTNGKPILIRLSE